jgi:hypothetical protein
MMLHMALATHGDFERARHMTLRMALATHGGMKLEAPELERART